MNWIFPDVAAVKAVQHDLIEKYGGSYGIRDEGLLESAVMRAQNKATYDAAPTTAVIAASLSFGLIKNHAFIDGNKRVGLAVLVDFLSLNGYKLTVSNKEQIAMVLQAAASEISEEEWTEWVERSTKAIP